MSGYRLEFGYNRCNIGRYKKVPKARIGWVDINGDYLEAAIKIRVANAN